MATAEALQKLETKAVAAEKLISILKLQIAEAKALQSSNPSSGESKEVEELKRENDDLRKEIEAWKLKLTQAEVRNGKTVVSAPVGGNAVPAAASESPVAPQEAAPKPAKPAKEKKEKPKAEKKKNPTDGGGDNTEAPVDVGRLDMRVGHIVSAKKHPDADSLYVEQVDVGEEKPRTVISGLVKFIPEEQMQDRMAVLLCNLKPSKMRGIMSEAMVMCASTPEKVEILSPPEGSKPGDPVLVDGFNRNPDGQLNPKKKIFEACAPDLSVNDNKEACYKGVRWTVNGKPVMSQTLVNVQVK